MEFGLKVKMIVLVFALCCLAWPVSADTYRYHPYYNWDPTYDGDWQVHYGCWAPAIPGLSVFDCPMDIEYRDYNFGCCLHFNDTGRDDLRLTCAYEGQRCLDGGVWVTGNKTNERPMSPNWFTTAADPWVGGSTIKLDEPDNSKGGVNPVAIIVSVIAGILVLGVAIICCCKCSAWCNKSRPDDLLSLVSQDDISYPRPQPRPIRPARRTGVSSVFIGVKCIQVVSPAAPAAPAAPVGPPSYADVEKENNKDTTVPPV